MELHSDIEDTTKVSLKKLRNSIGWYEIRKDINTSDNPYGKDVWDVTIPHGIMAVYSQTHAEILSQLVQIHERIKRIEGKLNE